MRHFLSYKAGIEPATSCETRRCSDHVVGIGIRPLPFWILDFGFWIGRGSEGYARSGLAIQNPKSKIQNRACTRKDSNLHQLVSKTSASADLGYACVSIWDLGFRIWDLGFCLVTQPSSRGQVHPKSKSEIRNPKLKWLRGKESNLYLLVQSQPSCRLDDPEMNLNCGF